ncbi:MAG TPA: transposase [Candidatus Brocadiia bacterium]|nr:transposase [Candidatus Brocadiia bacterium]
MARIARIVAPGLPHHVTQRGARRMKTFFRRADYEDYIALAVEWCAKRGVEVWAYCLMPNHVHLIAAPERADSLARALGEAHRRYSRSVNLRKGWSGYLWQYRFASFPLDEAHLCAAARHVELNPVRAGLVKRAEDYEWSSARAHATGRDDALVKTQRLLDIWPRWGEVLAAGLTDAEAECLRLHERTGRPLGNEGFVAGLESRLDRRLAPGKPGRPRKKA